MEPTKQNGSSDGVIVDVVETVATAAGTSPRSLEPQLSEVVDPDALERLVESATLTRVQFEYAGYTVVVDSDSTVTVESPATPSRHGVVTQSTDERSEWGP
jgi:hypothetical protein